MSLMLVLAAQAYETDQLTDRARPLADATPEAEAVLEPMLARAVEKTNRRSGCRGDDDRMRELLGRLIHKETGGKVWILSRGLFRASGYSRVSAALYHSDAERFEFSQRDDIYGDMTLWQSLILAVGGPCPTYSLAGVRTGSDKLDHFFDLGWLYLREMDRGKTESKAIGRGSRTEVQMFGMLTSKTFSYADLKANWDGLGFYRTLLTSESLFQRDESGCVEQVGPWSWADWVDSDWDEVLNPGVHTRLVERRLLWTLEKRRDDVCADRLVWDADGSRERRMLRLNDPVPWVRGRVPLRDDPYQLAQLCDPTRTEPLKPSRPHRFVRR